MSVPVSIASLRQQLAERFPSVMRAPGRAWTTGVPAWDEQTGGLPLGAVTELVAAAPSCGSHLLLGQLLAVARQRQSRAAWIDASDQFDPASFPVDLLRHLVWVRCRSVTEALAAADLLARDANFGLVMLDLRCAALRELRRVPATSWYRLQRAVEPSDLALVVATPAASVPSAQLRLELTRSAGINELDRERTHLIGELAPVLQRQRRSLAVAG